MKLYETLTSEEIYIQYYKECSKSNFRPVTRRQAYNYLSEIAAKGLIKIKKISNKRQIRIMIFEKEFSEEELSLPEKLGRLMHAILSKRGDKYYSKVKK